MQGLRHYVLVEPPLIEQVNSFHHHHLSHTVLHGLVFSHIFPLLEIVHSPPHLTDGNDSAWTHTGTLSEKQRSETL